MTGIMQMLLASFETGERYNLFGWGAGATTLGADPAAVGYTGAISSPVQVNSKGDWAMISAGENNNSAYPSLGIKTDGTLWAWGKQDSGGLGLNSLILRSSPTQVGSLTNWATVVNQAGNTYAKKTDGTLWAWGFNDAGGVGDGTRINRSSPVQIGSSTDWAEVGYGYAVKTNGTMWAWGFNFQGAVGDNTNISRSSPVQIGSLTNWRYPISVASTKLTVKTDGTLWAWGQNFDGIINGNSGVASSSPVQIVGPSNWARGHAGAGGHIGVYKTDGTLWAWGRNTDGQLGLNRPTSYYYSPQQVGALTNWATDIKAGAGSTVAIKLDGTLWSWGDGSGGRLGTSSLVKKSSPVQVGTVDKWLSLGGNGFYYGIRN